MQRAPPPSPTVSFANAPPELTLSLRVQAVNATRHPGTIRSGSGPWRAPCRRRFPQARLDHGLVLGGDPTSLRYAVPCSPSRCAPHHDRPPGWAESVGYPAGGAKPRFGPDRAPQYPGELIAPGYWGGSAHYPDPTAQSAHAPASTRTRAQPGTGALPPARPPHPARIQRLRQQYPCHMPGPRGPLRATRQSRRVTPP